MVVFASSTEEAAPFSIFSRVDAIQGNPDYGISATEPVSLNLRNNIVTFQWHSGLVWEMFRKFCQNHGVIRMVAEIRNE